MKVGNEIFSMVKFNGWKPGKFFVGVFITKPTDKIEKFARTSAINLGVEDFRDFVFEFPLNFNWWWRRLYTIWNFVRNCRF